MRATAPTAPPATSAGRAIGRPAPPAPSRARRCRAAAQQHVAELLCSQLALEPSAAAQLVLEHPALADADVQHTVRPNLRRLRSLMWEPGRVAELVQERPLLLAQPLERWLPFLAAYGLGDEALARLLREEPELFGCCIYEAGRAILLFKQHGYSDAAIQQRILRYYPQLLRLRVERDMSPVLHYLAQQGCRGEDLRRLLWEYPRIFCKDYRRRVRAREAPGAQRLGGGPVWPAR
jgi:hypothetical protein